MGSVRRLFLKLAVALALGDTLCCTPDAHYEPPKVRDEAPASAVCPFGVHMLAVGTDASQPPAPTTVRLADHGVLLAHRPRGASLAGYTPAVAQRFVDGAWIDDAVIVVDPCDGGGHAALTALAPSGPPGVEARGRWLVAACGARADAPTSSSLVAPSSDPAAWLDAPCADDLWLWLVTAQSCAEVAARFPDSPGGIYAIDPDGPGGDPPGEAFCDQRSVGGGWTQVLGVVDDGVSGPKIVRPASLRDGLAAAARREGYVGATRLRHFPSRGPFLELRFYCRRDTGAQLHITTESAAVLEFLLSLGESPPITARGTYYRVDRSQALDPSIYDAAGVDESQIGQNDHLWGSDQTTSPQLAWTGKWGERFAGAELDDRLALHPMVILPSDAGGFATAVLRGFRATKEARECDGSATKSPGEWRVFVR